jgi:two-component system, OmpR family, copper resistance phosphate regulon response regulator CusR
MGHILVVDDEKKMSAFIQQGFQEAGYTVTVVDCCSLARDFIPTTKVDLIVLDVMLPDMSGVSFAEELRQEGVKTPIILLSALSTTDDKISGLDAGADDYMTKPFEFSELHARAKVLIKRKSEGKSTLENGSLIMDLISRSVVREGVKIEVTTKEFALLEFFLRNIGKTVDRDTIARQVWGTDFDPDSNVIDVYINHLRKKIDTPFEKKLLKTVVGEGYVLNKFDSAV